MLRIIALETRIDLYGVYATGRSGPYGTPLLFKGTLDECLDYRRST